MNKPKMIMFDYGQTLISEGSFNGEAGAKAVLKHARKNPSQISARQLQEFVKTLNREIGRYDPDPSKAPYIEVHNLMFQSYLYEYYGIELDLTPEETERIFWDNAAEGKATRNVELLLDYLKEQKIRTAVISNISFSGKALKERIHRILPGNEFEFILATSEYVFRKPHNRIFELALRKAGLRPQEVWYCGDNAYYDVEGARQVGIFPVWYRGALQEHNKQLPKADCLTINDWAELVELIDKIASE